MPARNKTPKPVTLQDIADRCGVSKVAVSLALRSSNEIAEPTRKRIWSAARTLGYMPAQNAAAQRLAARKGGAPVLNQAVAVVFPLYVRGVKYFDSILAGVVGELSLRRYAAVYFELHHPSRHTIMHDLPPIFFRGELDGLILLPQRTDFRQFITFLRRQPGFANRPVVSVLSAVAGCPCVEIDEEKAGREIAEHVLGLGHRHVLFLTLPSSRGGIQRRLEGARAALRNRELGPARHLHVLPVHDLALDPTSLGKVPGLQPEWLSGAQLVNCLRDSSSTAVLAPNDACAWRCWHEIRTAGLRVPEDVSIVGFDDTEAESLPGAPLGLTSMRVPLEEIGRAAVRSLLRQDHATERQADRVVLCAELMVRGSTTRRRLAEEGSP